MKKITLTTLRELKHKGEKIAVLTAYDARFGSLLEDCGVEVLLVGDSLGMVLHGESTTLKVTLADMIYHTRLVRHGSSNCFLVADMPFMSYATPEQALGNAARLMREAGAEMVKIEGGRQVANIISHLGDYGIPVCAHLGLTPQSVHKLGGYLVQGRDQTSADTILQDAHTLQESGAEMLVLECVPAELATKISKELAIPVIGIGAGAGCDGQVLVLYDMLGLADKQKRFSTDFMSTSKSIREAIANYVKAVKACQFPASENQF